jgi:hypothetical protein
MNINETQMVFNFLKMLKDPRKRDQYVKIDLQE